MTLRDLGLTDPVTNDPSSTRIVGILLALAAIVFAFMHPEVHITIAELLSASGLSLGLRSRSNPNAP